MKYRKDKPEQDTKRALRNLGVKPSKKRGQNFLVDTSVIDEIVSFGAPQPGENLLEIGPGLGALTKQLYKTAPLTVIEIEDNFCENLKREYPELKIINQDVRQVDFSTLGSSLTVFGNLPYVYSTEIVFHLIKAAPFIKRAVLLLQKEFGERLGASPGGRDYGSLSVATQLWADVKLGPLIAGDRFHPPTKVTSQVIELTFLSKPRIDLSDPAWFERVVRASFSQRRKKLGNSLKASGMFSGAKITEALAAASIDPGRRAETLSAQEFYALSEALRP